MKATGIVRKLDKLGRIVLPKELRDSMHIQADDHMEVFLKKRRKHYPAQIRALLRGLRERGGGGAIWGNQAVQGVYGTDKTQEIGINPLDNRYILRYHIFVIDFCALSGLENADLFGSA